MAKTVFKTYRAGMPRNRGTKVHAMTEVRYGAEQGFVALCGTSNLRTTPGTYDGTQAYSCRRCANLRGTQDEAN